MFYLLNISDTIVRYYYFRNFVLDTSTNQLIALNTIAYTYT